MPGAAAERPAVPSQRRRVRPAAKLRLSDQTLRPCRSKTAHLTLASCGRSSMNSIAPWDGFGNPLENASTAGAASTPSVRASPAPARFFGSFFLIWRLVPKEPIRALAASKLTLELPEKPVVTQVKVPAVWGAFGGKGGPRGGGG